MVWLKLEQIPLTQMKHPEPGNFSKASFHQLVDRVLVQTYAQNSISNLAFLRTAPIQTRERIFKRAVLMPLSILYSIRVFFCIFVLAVLGINPHALRVRSTYLDTKTI